MLVRITMFLFGFGLTVIGSTYIISYLNLMSLGYNFHQYVNFIIRRLECWYLVIGIIILIITINGLGGNKDELYL